jgi:hypothetical protein
MKDPKSKRGAVRQYDAIIRACRRDLDGGGCFGMDWPTLRITFPERYARIQELRAMFAGLPS